MGLTLNGWFVSRTATPRFTVIVFNGNAGNRAHRAPLADALARSGLAVLLFDYRGYRRESGIAHRGRAEARCARGTQRRYWTRRDVDSSRLVYFGESLGTAVAAELAVGTSAGRARFCDRRSRR